MLEIKEECEDSFTTYEVHPSVPTTLWCTQCGKSFKTASQLKNHMWRHTGTKPFSCAQCGSGFTQHGNLKAHMRIHTGERPFKCPKCDSSFTQMSNLKSHLKIHTGEKPFQCQLCPAAFRQATNLKTHSAIHTGDRPHKCEECGKAFTQKSNLKAHKERIHKVLSANDHRKQANIIRAPVNLAVPHIYSQIIETKDQLGLPDQLSNTIEEVILVNDQAMNLLTPNLMPVNNEIEISCDNVPEIHINNTEDINPIYTDEEIIIESKSNDLICVQCDQKFQKKSVWVKHCWKHENLRTFFCEVCDKVFDNFHLMNRHCESHTNIKCFICHTFFSSHLELEKHLKIHKKAIYRMSRPSRKCFILTHRIRHRNLKYRCPETFRTKQMYTNGKFVTKCKKCNKKFTNRDLLQYHVCKSYGKPRGFGCSKCQRRFKSVALLRRHLTASHSSMLGHVYAQRYLRYIVDSLQSPAEKNMAPCFLEVCLEPSQNDVILNIDCDEKKIKECPNSIVVCRECRGYFSSLQKIKVHMKKHLNEQLKRVHVNERIIVISEDISTSEPVLHC